MPPEWLPPEDRDTLQEIVQNVLVGATVTAARVYVDGYGGLEVFEVSLHLTDGRDVRIGPGSLDSDRHDAIVLETLDGEGNWREMAALEAV